MRSLPGQYEQLHPDVVKTKVDDAGMLEFFQSLFDRTHCNIYTRDRKGDKVPKRLKVVSAVRVRNAELWAEYAACQRRIREDLAQISGEELQRVNADTGNVLARAGAKTFKTSVPGVLGTGASFQIRSPVSGRDLAVSAPAGTKPGQTIQVLDPSGPSLPGTAVDASINEVVLFHGTDLASASSIVSDNFRLNFAGSRTGSLYGRGAYFAESCTKADEYAGVNASGLHTIVMCRVTLGHALHTEEVTPDPAACEELCRSKAFHSVVGDRRRSRGTFREFVVFDESQVSASYVLQYRRIFD